MSMKVELLPGEPIALVTGSGALTTEEITGAYREVAALANQWGTTVYAVYDLNRIKIAWGTALAGMNTTVKKLPGSPTDERVVTVLVGTSDVVRTAGEALHKPIWGGLDIKVFETVDEALGYSRTQAAIAR